MLIRNLFVGACLLTAVSVAEEVRNDTEPKSCDKPIKETVLAECKKLNAKNPVILDGGFTPGADGSYTIPVSADTKAGFYSINFKVVTTVSKDKSVCKIVSIKEIERHPHP